VYGERKEDDGNMCDKFKIVNFGGADFPVWRFEMESF